jgi:hypothetical protein
MRPNYETQADRNREFVAKRQLGDIFGPCMTVVKLHKHYIIDFVVLDNKKIVAVCEFKTAKYSIGKYPTFMMSLNKWNKGLEYFNLHNVPFYILAKYTEGFYLHEYSPSVKYWIELGGRRDRDDPLDIEPIIRVKTEDFRYLGRDA